ncbi:MAG: allantoinase AllB [Bryobacteraceae bacterium]
MNSIHAVRSSRIVTPSGLQPGVVVISGGKILGIAPFGESFDSMPITDVGDYMVLPGLIDVHSHLNEPGRTEWEGFETGTKAAAAGGFTTIVDMPLNCIPSTTCVQALREKRAAVSGKASVDYAFWAGAVPGNSGQIAGLADAGVKGFKCFLVPSGTDEFSMVEQEHLTDAMPAIAETGLPLLAHAELPGPIAEATDRLEDANWRAYNTYLHSRPEGAETEAIRLLIDLVRRFQCRVHIVHLSAAAGLHDLETARAQALPLTVETCPHYLYFSAENIPDGYTEFKCAPPIREGINQALLWEALRSGDIDMIATDHSPCPPALKCRDSGDFRRAWGGIISLSVSLPVIWTAARNRGFHITDLVRWMSQKPASLAGLSSVKGSIAPGQDADLVIFDPDATFKVSADEIPSRHKLSPYIGETVTGSVLTTIVRGQIVYQQGQYRQQPIGREVR